MKTCIKCNLDYEDDKKFCKNCGAPLSIKPRIEQAVEVKKQVLEEKLTNDPQNVALLHEYLNFLIKHEINHEALKIALKILAINESDESAQETLFELYPKLQMYEEALEVGELILYRKKNDIKILESVLAYSSNIDDEERKRKYTGLLLSLDENNHKGLYQKALMLLEEKQLEKASKIFEKLASEGYDDRISVIYAAIYKIMEQNFQDGRQILDKALTSEDIQPKDMDNNRGFLYLTYCLCKQDEEIEEIDRWFSRIEFQVLDEEHTNRDELIAGETIREIFRKVFSGEKINYATVHKINLLANQYFGKNSFYFTELTKDIVADIWLIIGEKQLELKLSKDAFLSLEKSKSHKSTDQYVLQEQSALSTKIDNLRKKKRRKSISTFVIVIIIIAVGIAGIQYLQYSNQEKAFAKAKSKNTYESFDQYLAFYPDGRYVNEAKELQEMAFWEEAKAINTHTSYQKYLNHYSKGKHKGEAEAKQEEAYWVKVKDYNNVDSLNNYIKNYPQGKYLNEVNNLIDQIIKVKKQEQQSKRESEIAERKQREREMYEKQKKREKEIAEKMGEREMNLVSKIRNKRGDYIDGDVYVNDGRSIQTTFKERKNVLIMHPKSKREPAYIEIECFIPYNGVKVIGEYASCNYDPMNKKNKTSQNNDYISRIVVIDENNRRYVLNKEVVSYKQGWISKELSLNDFVGKIIRLRFENSAGGRSTWYFEFSAVAAFYIYSSNNESQIIH